MNQGSNQATGQDSGQTINQIRQALVSRIGALGRIRYTYRDPVERYRARSLIRLVWGAVIVSMMALIYELATPIATQVFAHLGSLSIDPYIAIVFIVVIFSVISLITITLLVNRGLVTGAGLAFVLLLFVAAILVYVPSGLNSFTMFALSMPIVGAGVLLDRRAMLIVIALITLTLGLTVTLEAAGLLINFTTGNPSISDTLIDGLLIIIVDGIMLNIYAGGLQLITRRNKTLLGQVRSLTTFSEAVTRIDNLDDLLEQAVDLIRDQLGYYHVQIFLVEVQTHLVVLRAGTGIFHTQTDANRRRIAPSDNSVINDVVRGGTSLRINQNAAAIQQSEFLAPTRAELLLPLRRQEQVLGVLDVQSIRADAFAAEDIQVLEAVAGELSISVQNARLVYEFQELFRERQHLQEELRSATVRLDQHAEDVSGGNWLRFIQQRSGKPIGFDWREGVLTPITALSPTLEQTIKDAIPELGMQDGQQILTVPIVLRGETLGAMEFRAPRERLWSPRTLELVRIIAQRLALALDNIRLFEQAQITATREQVANQVAARLQSRTDIDALLAVAADSFQQALGATRTSILLGPPSDTHKDSIGVSGSQLSTPSTVQPQPPPRSQPNGNGG